MRFTTLILALAAGCSEYDISAVPEGATAPIPEVAEGAPDPTPEPEPQVDPPTAPAPLTCADFTVPTIDWFAGPSFTGVDAPTDAAGLAFHDPAHDITGWPQVGLPDRSIPTGLDGVYVGFFDLADALPPSVTMSLQSDDGIWLYVNGVEVGHWGGGWQEEGCVNENAECLETTTVDPVDLLPWVQPGANAIAARVSNPIMNSFFDVILACED